MSLTSHQRLAFGIELRDLTSACLFHFATLEQAATKWVAVEDAWKKAGGSVSLASEQLLQQQRLFDATEAFLAALARLSLILFPSPTSGPISLERGRAIRDEIALPDSSPFADRELRNSWMHHDERLDAALHNGAGVLGQLFKRTTDITSDTTDSCLRVIAVDTLVVHYRKQDGTKASTALTDLKFALIQLDDQRTTLLR